MADVLCCVCVVGRGQDRNEDYFCFEKWVRLKYISKLMNQFLFARKGALELPQGTSWVLHCQNNASVEMAENMCTQGNFNLYSRAGWLTFKVP